MVLPFTFWQSKPTGLRCRLGLRLLLVLLIVAGVVRGGFMTGCSRDAIMATILEAIRLLKMLLISLLLLHHGDRRRSRRSDRDCSRIILLSDRGCQIATVLGYVLVDCFLKQAGVLLERLGVHCHHRHWDWCD